MTTANLAVADVSTVIQYTSTGETAFTFPWLIRATSEIKVSVDAADQVEGSDYTVSGVDSETGGTVTFTSATTAGEIITIWLEIPLARPTGFAGGAAVLLPTALNNEFIRQLRIDQMHARDIGRAIRLPIDDTGSGSDMELPPAPQRKGKYMRFDSATGENLEMADITASTTVLSQSVIAALFWPEDPIEAGNEPTVLHWEYVNVMRYGADPTGVADSYGAWQKAINICISSEYARKVYGPAGRYRIDNKLTVTLTGANDDEQIMICGDGVKTILDTNVLADTTLEISDARQVHVRDLSIEGNGLTGASGNGHGVAFLDSNIGTGTIYPQKCFVTNVTVSDCRGDATDQAGATVAAGIYVHPGLGIYVRNPIVESCGQGVYFDGTQNSHIWGGLIDTCDRWGVFLNAVGDGCSVIGLDFASNGIDVNGDPAVYSSPLNYAAIGAISCLNNITIACNKFKTGHGADNQCQQWRDVPRELLLDPGTGHGHGPVYDPGAEHRSLPLDGQLFRVPGRPGQNQQPQRATPGPECKPQRCARVGRQHVQPLQRRRFRRAHRGPVGGQLGRVLCDDRRPARQPVPGPHDLDRHRLREADQLQLSRRRHWPDVHGARRRRQRRRYDHGLLGRFRRGRGGQQQFCLYRLQVARVPHRRHHHQRDRGPQRQPARRLYGDAHRLHDLTHRRHRILDRGRPGHARDTRH